MDMHTTLTGQRKYGTKTFELDNGSESFIIINAFFLGKTLSDKPGFVLYTVVQLRLKFVHPFGANGRFARRERHPVVGAKFVNGSHLTIHGSSPVIFVGTVKSLLVRERSEF